MPSSTLARTLVRLRPPFTVALVGLVVLITAATATAIGGLAWREQRARSRAIVDAAMAQTARLAASHTQQFLREAESIARLGPQLVAQGQLNPRDDARRGALRARRAAVESAAGLGELQRAARPPQ